MSGRGRKRRSEGELGRIAPRFLAAAWSLGGVLSCAEETTPEPLTGPCDASCLVERTLLVASASGACGGVLWSERSNPYVLTAAHCARRALRVRSLSGAMRISVDQDGSTNVAPGSIRDLILLPIRGPLPKLTRHPLPALPEGEFILTRLDGSESRVFESIPLRLHEQRDLSADFEANGRELCFGSSGSPVWRRGREGFSLYGLVSSGSRQCDGHAQVIRIEALAWNKPSSGSESGQRCAACIEELGAGLGPCVTALERCRSDLACRTALSGLRGHGTTLDLTPNLNRCVEAHGCAAICGRPESTLHIATP